MPGPFSLFSSAITDTLDRIATRVAALAPRTGPRVLIVPGLPGSQLGHAPHDAIWFDFESLRRGRFVELAEGAPGPAVQPLGVFEALYLPMVLRLGIAGYDVDYFPYDWRRPVPDVGADLADRIRSEGREVHLIAHSFGALVARAAVALDPPDLGRVIMLGPTNQGTFAMVQALRGAHWALRLASAIDGRRSARELAEQVIATWPSIPQGLPSRLLPDDIDLFDLASWPTKGPRPAPDLLAEAAAVQRSLEASAALPSIAGRFVIVAGHGVPTVERVERDGDGFRYHLSDDGDGFVPTPRARLEGQPSYHVRSAHTGMANHPEVIEAVLDLLRTGTTDRLSRTPPARTERPSFGDADVPDPPFDGRRGLEVDLADVRAAFDEVLGVIAPILV